MKYFEVCHLSYKYDTTSTVCSVFVCCSRTRTSPCRCKMLDVWLSVAMVGVPTVTSAFIINTAIDAHTQTSAVFANAAASRGRQHTLSQWNKQFIKHHTNSDSTSGTCSNRGCLSQLHLTVVSIRGGATSPQRPGGSRGRARRQLGDEGEETGAGHSFGMAWDSDGPEGVQE